MPNKDKVLALVMPACNEKRLGDILKLYWIERRNLGITDSSGYTFNMSHTVGYVDADENNTLATYQSVLLEPFYLIRYYHFAPAVVPTATIIADANTEDMTVVRLTRDNIVEHAMDFFAMEYYVWGLPGAVGVGEVVDTQAEVDIINTEAQNMVITDTDLARFKIIRDESNAVFDTIAASGIIDFTRDYDSLPWENPVGVLSQLLPDPNVPTDTIPLRRTPLTSATRTIIDTNNDLTNRINQLFV
jgi:hypothetical protein